MELVTKTVPLKGFGRWYAREYTDDHWLDVTRLPIVGSQFHGVTPYHITGPLSVCLEPENKADPSAVAILDGTQIIGYVTRDKRHLIRDEPGFWFVDKDWDHLPKLVSSSDDWAIFHVRAKEA